jgi:hypothetical protein
VSYRFHDLGIATSNLSLPELSRTTAPADISVRLADRIDDAGAQWFHRWTIAGASGRTRRTPWLSFARLPGGGGFLLRFHSLADFAVSLDGTRITCAAGGALPRTTLRHLLLDQVLPLTLHLRGRLALHASAVHVPGFGAIAFAGPAGSGKSTLAAALALRGCRVVSDDCLLFAPGAPSVVIPGYPGVRLWPDSARALRLERGSDRPVAHYTRKQRAGGRAVRFRADSTPLRALFVVGRRRRAGDSRVRSLSARDRFIALVPYAWLIDVADPPTMARIFDQLHAVVSNVPVARLNARDGRRMLTRTADEVLALARAAVGAGRDS